MAGSIRQSFGGVERGVYTRVNVAPADAPASKRGPISIAWPVAAIAVSVAARLVFLQFLHPLNWDEIEFFRATDWVRRGLVPYRDFWEHHTPLQWFVFAPITGLTSSPGADAILLMRWAQVPLWIAIFFLINRWMRGVGLSPFARWTAMAFTLTSTLFMLPAVEYRVDVLAGGLLIAGLLCIQRMDRSIWIAMAAGAAFCLSGFANLRMGPVLVLTMLMARIIDFRERRWGGNVRANWIFVGAAAMFALCACYFVATGSAVLAFRHLITENFVADRYAQPEIAHMFLHRVLSPFGFHLAPGEPLFTPSMIDPGGMVVVIVGTIGMIRMLGRFRTPDDQFFMAYVQFANLLFIAAMKYIFTYHFGTAAVLMVPLIAEEIEALGRRRIVLAVLLITTVVNVTVAIFRGKEADLRFQDTIMREVDARTPSGSAVWDSAGFALHRRPAYRYWFLRSNVRILVQHGDFAPYRVADVLRDPPAAVIADYATREWMAQNVPLAVFFSSEYLPTWTNLWLPGLSARLRPGTGARWFVPAGGTYAVYASPRLALHPWFANPIDLERPWWHDRALTEVREEDRAAAPVAFFVNGRPLPAGTKSIDLTERDVVVAVNRATVPVGIMLAREPRPELFLAPPDDVTIEASASPQWHVPNF